MTVRPGAARAPLSDELHAASIALGRLAAGDALPAALDAAIKARGARLPAASRPAVRDIASRTVRTWGLCRALSARLNQRPPTAPMLMLQQVALAQLLDPVRADSTTVDQAVEAAKADPALRAGAGFLNATLRRFLREREALVADATTNDDVARWNFPDWWIETLREAYPEGWSTILDESNRPPPLVVRVNRRRITVDDWLASLAGRGLGGTRIGPQAVRLDAPVAVERLPGWADGLVSVQDAGAQIAAALLDVRDGMRVLDACAAPGGKTTHVLELAAADVVALDPDSQRLARVGDNLARLGLAATLVAGDANAPAEWHDGRAFERILVDAPCTASGIVRRQPDVRWRRRRRDLTTFSDGQLAMLASLWPLLAPGGKLLYSTCSVFPAEGEAVIARFSRAHPDAVRLPLTWSFAGPSCANRQDGQDEPVSQLLPRAGATRDHDGFFYAMLEKRV